MRHELTEPAERDIRDILRNTMQMFAPQQVRAYARIIELGIELISEDPDRPGSIERAELAAGVRLLHLEIAAGRRGGAAHCLYYMKGRLSDDTIGVIVVRVLHERMEPRHRVTTALKDMARAKVGSPDIPDGDEPSGGPGSSGTGNFSNAP
ncbi:type II toxin-antitoxin system RelE/ParE family toxin [Mesorhizobium delmotii]|uniref:Plasmid stabilisation system protein (Modular protein) n=1 Tax=Mesorhizobium delmotii TaxID=1631247 RepID=A0A2P9A9M0_9HYPH|nr:type II toxin-antitoxin system RelE/ParE family toxin [Mesorhizobium delmotii]SJM27815.1 Plasmid stabilisation system protein (modular protein) [Mesorhizobium delmotii]